MDQKQLRELEDKCIQECAPPCAAACPLHVDARAIALELGRGEYGAALAILKKTLPFPGIISRVCDHPCTAVCRRDEAGGAIDIRALERACLEHGSPEAEKPRPKPKRRGRVAVVGGGISGLTAAYDLARKGYAVTIYEAGERLGGNLWHAVPHDLPEEVLLNDIAAVTDLGVEVRYNTAVGRRNGHRRLNLNEEHDAAYVAIGGQAEELLGLELDETGRVSIDPLTFATGQKGIFAGGGLRWGSEMRSAITSMSEGRRAAISIDRYLQNVSLTASRVNEGPYPTRLYTNLEGVEARPVISMGEPAEGYAWHEVMQEAKRCLQCDCMECVKVCDYLKHFGRYPRKYVREIYNNLSIVSGTRSANRLINSCSLCGLCAEVCPEGLDMAAVIRPARQQMVQQKRMPPSAHDFALRDMAFSTGDKFALARHQPGATTSEYVFFPGCQLSASYPEEVQKVYADLSDRLPGGVGLILGCCGAPADWAGRVDLYEATRSDLQEKLRALGNPKVVLACSTCYKMFKTNLPEAEIVSLWEVFEQRGLPAKASTVQGRTVAVHDPCTTRHEGAIQDSARALLHRLGYAVEELKYSRDKTMCCGYGGSMWLANPEVARKVVDRRAAESPLDYVTYCAMCRDFLAARGKPTLHLLELIYGNGPEQSTRPGPGYSQRHENRARLKRRLLKEFWGESMDGQQPFELIRLIVADEVKARLEERLILVEDIQRVIEYAERTGARLLNRQTGRYLAHYKPTSVTYWVEYAPEGEAFVIFNAYSHRMEVGGSAQP